jgi:hypothetical protein
MTIPQPTPGVCDIGEKTPEQLLRDRDFEELRRKDDRTKGGTRAGNVFTTFRLQILRLTDQVAAIDKRLALLEGNPNARPDWAIDLAATVRIQGAALQKLEAILAAACEGADDPAEDADAAPLAEDRPADLVGVYSLQTIEQFRDWLEHMGRWAGGQEFKVAAIENLAVSVGNLLVGLIYELRRDRDLAECLAEVERRLERCGG